MSRRCSFWALVEVSLAENRAEQPTCSLEEAEEEEERKGEGKREVGVVDGLSTRWKDVSAAFGSIGNARAIDSIVPAVVYPD